MKIKKIEVGNNNLKKYMFLFIKGHLNNGLLMGQIMDMLDDIQKEVVELFLKRKREVDVEKDYPYLLDSKGEQIGQTVEEYKANIGGD